MTARRDRDAADPRGLMREAFAMDIAAPECRSIFLDWALDGVDPGTAIPILLERHGDRGDHPMMRVLRDGLRQPARTGRRGGRRGRLGGQAD